MNPVLTIWTDQGTAITAAKVAGLLNDTADDDRHEAIRAYDMTAETLADELTEKYRRLIRLTDADTTLHIVAVMPLYEPTFQDSLSKILRAVSMVADRISLHLIVLRKSLTRILSCSNPAEADSIEAGNLECLEREAPHGAFSYTVIDDYVESGAPLDFSVDSLSSYIAEILSALAADYNRILSPGLLACGPGHIGIGLSSLRFNRRKAVNMLLHKTFIKALENAGIDRKEVDTQKCLSIAADLLRHIDHEYPSFYEQNVTPIYKDGALSEGEIAAKIEPAMKERIGELRERLTSFIDRTDLSLPEKEGVLSLILGSDNACLRGVQYEQEYMLADDVCNEPLDIYIEAFNAMPKGARGHLLPVRGNYKHLKKYVYDDNEEEYVESPENSEAFNPLSDIKRLKREILDSTAYIRRKSDELLQLEQLVRQRESVARQAKNYVRPTAEPLPEIKEQPLKEQYTLPRGLRPMESVDLRPYFSEIRNQDKLGSCSTFAVVSMYEAIMNRLQKRDAANRANLSEQFIYHYSNVIKGRPGGGSNYFEQLEIMCSHGVCEESLFGYSVSNLGAEPPQAAIDNAMTHRVVKALQIPLTSAGDKIEAIHNNHRLLTSALTEGHPVGIALKLYRSFGENCPYINRPTEADLIEGPCENHAMVLVGYSESNGSYIVRNSWGEEFGDKGYCYISSSYIDDPDFNIFSCIITETTEQGAIDDRTPEMVAPLAGTQNEIDMAVIRNTIDKVKLTLNNDQTLYEEYYRYYSTLMQQLCVPQIRSALRKEAESQCLARLTEISLERQAADSDFVPDYKNFKRRLLKNCLKATGISLLLVVATALICFEFDFAGRDVKISSLIVSAVAVLATALMWIDKVSRQRRRHHNMEEEMQQLAIVEHQIRQELFEKQLKYHVAGMWIDNFHNLKIELEKTSNRLTSYISNLRQWMDDDRRSISTPHARGGEMFIPLEDVGLLDSFFATNVDRLTDRIDLMRTFSNYSVDSETIQQARKRLDDDVSAVIEALFADFRIFDCVTGTKSYPYVKIDPTETLTARMVNVGQIAARHSTRDSDFPIRHILISIDSDTEERLLHNTLDRHFPSRAGVIRVTERDSLTLLTLRPIPQGALR